MLSRTSALRATRSKSSDLLRSAQTQHASPRHLQSATTRRFRTNAASNGTHPLSSAHCLRRKSIGYKVGSVVTGKRYNSSATEEPEKEAELQAELDDVYELIDKVATTEAEILELLDELDLTDAYAGAGALEDAEFDAEADDLFESAATPEEKVRLAKQMFKDRLPEGILNEEETLLYTTLYGEPIVVPEETEEPEADQLLRQDASGGWEEVEYDEVPKQQDEEVVYDMESAPEEETDVMRRTREVAEQLGGDVLLDPMEDEEGEGAQKHHHLTMEGRSGTDPRTVFMPNHVKKPIEESLRGAPIDHLRATAKDIFGGQSLPQSTTVATPRKQEPQKAIPLRSSQRFMSNMEANVYLAVLYPAMYASVLSVLTEVRKRLGHEWLRGLISKENGPNVLDAGAGGAGISAWRDILRAEYEVMVPDHPASDPVPLGRSTVLTGSDPLRHRASAMLENTTFFPRLPDYLHVREGPTLEDKRPVKRKQFDVILAPHALMGFDEDYERKEYIENLWQMLSPDGGVLVLLEKGHQKGFEAVAGAREMLLKRHISSPGSTEYEAALESPEEDTTVQKEPGMIVAPCTNHEQCPMYTGDGHQRGRKDHCHFAQRYIRPRIHQKILHQNSFKQNHEDLKFSYLAVRRGVDLRETEGVIQGPIARDAAVKGYEENPETSDEAMDGIQPTNPETTETNPTESTLNSTTSESPDPTEDVKFHTLSLPRLVYSPMKRRGHVIMDMCTPAGKIERWTVPRSFSKQAFKDARKASWGDLWALGAKTAIARNLRLGVKGGESKKERLERRRAEREEMKEEREIIEREEGPVDVRPKLEIPRRKKGEKKVPAWKKGEEQKKFRRASRKEARDL